MHFKEGLALSLFFVSFTVHKVYANIQIKIIKFVHTLVRKIQIESIIPFTLYPLYSIPPENVWPEMGDLVLKGYLAA